MNKKRDILWAPWRMTYIRQNNKRNRCFLCSAIKDKEKNDKKNFILYRGESVFVIVNIFPYNNGHLMVVPKRHISNLANLQIEEEKELFFLIRESVRILSNKLKPNGFNIGLNLGRVAGAGVVGHIHFHIVPRWDGDTNFMPVVSGTKVISQSLDELYKLLYSEFKELRKCI